MRTMRLSTPSLSSGLHSVKHACLLQYSLPKGRLCGTICVATYSPTSKGVDTPGSSGATAPAKRRSTATQNALDDGKQRLAKVMAAAGVASRRACEDLIAAGQVKVNGTVASEQGTKVDPSRDRVEVRGQGVSLRPPALYYFAVHKPKGFICSSTDPAGRGKRAVDLLDSWLEGWARRSKDQKALPPRFFTVGRLDVASTGLIFLTNDGQWAQKVIHPSANITKEYLVRLDRPASSAQLSTMMAGTSVDSVQVAPRELEVLEGGERLRMVVSEGKKHEVRLIVAAAGLEVMSLKRVRVGGYRLPRNLGIGGYLELTPLDLKAVVDPRAQDRASQPGRQQPQGPQSPISSAARARSVPAAAASLLTASGKDLSRLPPKLRKALEGLEL